MPDYSPNFTSLPEQQNPEQQANKKSESSSGTDDEYIGDSKFVAALVKYSFGLIKSEEQANYLGIGVAVAIIIMSALIVLNS